VLVPKFLGLKLVLVFLFVNFLEDILEAAIVLLKNGVLGAQIKRIVSLKSKLETGMSKLSDRFVGVVHAEHHSAGFELEDLHVSGLGSIFRDE
jgi:hypothetical protein